MKFFNLVLFGLALTAVQSLTVHNRSKLLSQNTLLNEPMPAAPAEPKTDEPETKEEKAKEEADHIKEVAHAKLQKIRKAAHKEYEEAKEKLNKHILVGGHSVAIWEIILPCVLLLAIGGGVGFYIYKKKQEEQDPKLL